MHCWNIIDRKENLVSFCFAAIFLSADLDLAQRSFSIRKIVAVYSKVVQKSKRILCDIHQKYYGLNCFGVMSGRKKWN